VAEVFAGFVAGYVVALLSTPLLAYMLFRLRMDPAGIVSRFLPEGANAVAFGMIVHGILFVFWTGIGIVLGMVLLGMEDEGKALGSLNGPFSLFVAGFTLAVFAPVAILVRGVRNLMLGYALTVVLVFGWLLPYMAKWSRIE
jgi:hypothetical protein